MPLLREVRTQPNSRIGRQTCWSYFARPFVKEISELMKSYLRRCEWRKILKSFRIVVFNYLTLRQRVFQRGNEFI